MIDSEHLDQIAGALELRDARSLFSRNCNIGQHSRCIGTSYSLTRLHPQLAVQKRVDRGATTYDQAFPCMCECHGPFEEHEE